MGFSLSWRRHPSFDNRRFLLFAVFSLRLEFSSVGLEFNLILYKLYKCQWFTCDALASNRFMLVGLFETHWINHLFIVSPAESRPIISWVTFVGWQTWNWTKIMAVRLRQGTIKIKEDHFNCTINRRQITTIWLRWHCLNKMTTGNTHGIKFHVEAHEWFHSGCGKNCLFRVSSEMSTG